MAKKKKPIPVDKKIEKLIEIYKQAEIRLIKTITEKQAKGNVTTFYKKMLKQVQQEILRLQIFHTQWATDITKQLYMQAYEEALSDLGISDNTLTQLHKEAINLIAENIVNNLNEATDLVGRRVEDEIRNISLDSTTDKFATGSTIKQMQKELANNLIDNNITSFKDRLGRNINISAYAEMIARSIVAETQNTCVMNTMFEHGNDLVKMSTHFGTCSVCATYEGRVYSITGHDERFPRLDEIPGFNKGYNNIHPRCRHRIRAWVEKYNDVEKEIENSNRPFEVDKDKEVSVRAYQEEQKEKARLRNDKKQYERYKQVLGKEIPKNLQNFRKIKYNDNKKWNEIKEQFSREFIKKDFDNITLFHKNCSDLLTRKWYMWHDENIPNLINTNKSIEEQAMQAHELRNKYRTQARDLMKNQEERKQLDIDKPNISFEDLILSKMKRKGKSREEAIKDILKTATKTNKEVNKSLGLE